MKENVFKAALAGLLHDIGKFAQRAGDKLELETIIPAMWRDDVASLMADESQNGLIPLARQFAAGSPADTGQGPDLPLQSIFGSITGLSDKNNQRLTVPKLQYLPLKKLAVEPAIIFPIDKKTDLKSDYENLWREFVAEAAKLRTVTERHQADLKAYLPSLLDLMQQYTWCIPTVAADVSLYDHSRMTAALATCLANKPTLPATGSDEPVAVLIGGDISGVQKFIYNITSRGATPGLRGRSMYLQLLTEVIARYLLDELDLPLTNIIYAGGGHMYLLAPLSADEKLLSLQQRISRILLHRHQGDLYLALTSEQITAAEFRGELFHARWDALQRKLQQVKQRKFAELGAELADLLFRPMEDGGDEEKQCVVCQREHPETKQEDPENERSRKCPVCQGFEDLGDNLRNAHYLCLDQIEPSEGPELTDRRANWYEILQHFGYQVQIAETLGQIDPLNKRAVKRRNLLALSDSARDEMDIGAGQTIGRRLLVNVTPKLTTEEVIQYSGQIEDVDDLKVDKVKPFELLVKQSKGIKRLGVLRMDVDNLGQIFSQGLPKDKYTLSRMAVLSFSMSLFFEGWIAPLAQEVDQKYPYPVKDHKTGKDNQFIQRLYSIYSGGDDLFFVGAWDLMPALAERINSDLKKYTGNHPGFHISGGIALIPAKYPLYQAADDAAEAESAAKSPRPNSATEQADEMTAKNALAFLGAVVPWDKYGEVHHWQTELVALVAPTNGHKAVPRSLLQRLRELYIVFDKQRQAQQKAGQVMKVYWGPGQWRSAYSLSRLAQQYKNDERIKEALLKVRDNLSSEQFTNIQWLGLAARWAALLTRKSGE